MNTHRFININFMFHTIILFVNLTKKNTEFVLCMT